MKQHNSVGDKKKEICVGTSLSPYNLEWQVKCIKSWKDSGFRIVSCNIREEIDKLERFLEELDIEIEFVEIEKSADDVVGKPLPFIKEILLHAAKRCDEVCGFLNADIYISHMSADLYEFVCEEAKQSLLFVRRNEINDISDIADLNWELHFDGIDLFFIDKNFVSEIVEEEFYVQSIWDLAILTKAQLLQIPIKELRNPVAFHKRHSVKWDFVNVEKIANRFWERNFEPVENAYELILQNFYAILLSETKAVCFCHKERSNCLFVVEHKTEETVTSIRKQDWPFITISQDDVNKRKFDYIIYVKDRVILSSVFVRYFIYIMQEFGYGKLEFGKFFISWIDEKERFNELNRNLKLLKYINEECGAGVRVVKSSVEDSIIKKIYIPDVREKIDIYDKTLFRQYKLQGDMYIAPAGVRGSEWYRLNRYKLGKGVEFQGYLDNNPQKEGRELLGYKIFSMKHLTEREVGCVVIASKYYSLEIYEQVATMIEKSKIVDASCICDIDENGIVHLFDLEKYKKVRR